jgi:hypothetical protein
MGAGYPGDADVLAHVRPAAAKAAAPAPQGASDPNQATSLDPMGSCQAPEPSQPEGVVDEDAEVSYVDAAARDAAQALERQMKDPNNVVFAMGGCQVILALEDWPAYFASKVKPSATLITQQMDDICRLCAGLWENNQNKPIASRLVAFFGGQPRSTPADIATRGGSQVRLPLHDIDAYGQRWGAQKCIACLDEAARITNEAGAALQSYYASLEKGTENTVKVIKITAAGAVVIATGGAAAAGLELGVGGQMLVAGAEAVGFEGADLAAKAIDPGQTVGWADVQKSIVNIAAKAGGAGLGKYLAGPLAQRFASGTSAAHQEKVKGAIERYIATAYEETMKAANESKSWGDFFGKLETVGLKAAVAAVGGEKMAEPLKEAVPEAG